MTETIGVPPKTFTLVTTAQVERVYVVQAETEQQAKDRLHIYLNDPDGLREGVVKEVHEKQTDVTKQKLKSTKAAKQPAPKPTA